MKKTLILGAAAVAAMGIVSTSDAGEVKMSGYYQFRVQNADQSLVDETGNNDDTNRWVQRLQLNMDFMASQKTHAHMRVRILDTDIVEGAETSGATSNVASDAGDGDTLTTDATTAWNVRQMWLETEMWGVGVKVGNMPLDFNDKILVNHDTSSFGSIVLSKTFGDVTVAGMNVRIEEGQDGSTADVNASEDDVDLYGLTVLGKINNINYQATGAYLYIGETAIATTASDSLENGWLALTLGGQVSGIDLTGTAIYDTGGDVDGAVDNEDDILLALRAKGKVSFGGWNAYAMYSGEAYNNIVNGAAEWSPTWDMGGAGAADLMKVALGGSGVSFNAAGNTADTSADVGNVWAIGAGLAIDAGGWTIKPYLDYMDVVETDINDDDITDSLVDDAWGGSLILSTKIDTDTTLELSGNYVDPDATTGNDATAGDAMHQLLATVTMKF